MANLGGFRNDLVGNQIVTPRAFEFTLGDASVNVAVTAVAQALSLSQTVPNTGCQVLLTNVGTQTIFIRTDGTASTTAVGWPMLANTQIVVTFTTGSAISVIAAATGSTLYATAGFGQ